jgi:nicotinate-nucleotide pyrophosphorylase
MDHRDFTRMNISEWGTITYNHETFGGQVENISLRGLFIQTSKKLPLHVPVEAKVHHAIDKSLEFNATVVRLDENGLGLLIDKMDVDSLVYLRNLLSAHADNHEQVVEEVKKAVQNMKE